MYPALPMPRRLSSFDPEWEEDPEFTKTQELQIAQNKSTKTLPSPAVLRDILQDRPGPPGAFTRP
jgi:hypothetical protein